MPNQTASGEPTEGQTFRTPQGDIDVFRKKRRPPVEAIAGRKDKTADCEKRVRQAVTKLVKTGAPFTIENVIALSGVSKTFIYDKNDPTRTELTQMVLAARDASQAAVVGHAEKRFADESASWRERATNAEALAKQLRAALQERDNRINDLTGQLYDSDGTHLADENTQLRAQLKTLHLNLQEAMQENGRLRRSLEGSRANVKKERERNVLALVDHNPQIVN